ncbi:MAG: hypothetical protein OER77_09225, partial [Myxococcales bacterium]|nr:hypothetical protein [Myxococcales bacterium]
MSRIERKILFAIGLTVFVTLGGSIFFAQGALREVYRVGVNERFGQELVHGVEARRGQLVALRESSEQVADAIGWAVEAELTEQDSPRGALEALLVKLLDRYPDVRGVRVVEGDRLYASASRKPEPSGDALRATIRSR